MPTTSTQGQQGRRNWGEYHRQRRAEKKARGECRDCTSSATRAGLCDYHHERQRIAAKKHSQRKLKAKAESGECYRCSEQAVKWGFCEKHFEDHYRFARKSRIANREKVFDHYGRECNICGATENLVIDHINEDGKEHRAKERIQSGSDTYWWLVNNEFPQGFQTLCTRCNIRKHYAHKRQLQLAQAAD